MRYLTALAFLTSGSAFAECPTANHLETGIRVTETDGTINLFSAMGDGVIKNEGSAPDGYTYRNLLAHGTHLIELGDTENGAYVQGSVRTIDYGVTNPQLPIPAPNSSHAFETVVDDASFEYSERQTQTWGAVTTLTIGDCVYDMIPGKVVYENSDYNVQEGLFYLPDLELALLHSYQVKGEAPFEYVAVRIEAVQ